MENPYPIEKKIEHALNGSIKFGDCFILQKILSKEKPKTCLEIGSFLGFSTYWLLECSKDWDMHLTAIDPNIRHRIFDNPRWVVEGLNACFYPDRLDILSGFFGKHEYYSSDYENYLPHRSKAWAKNLFLSRLEIDGKWHKKFDCIYIDANHDYASVMDGFKNAIKLLKPNGLILFHDALTWKDVNRALKDIEKNLSQKAHVEILNGSKVFEHPILKNEPSKVSDGLGVFKLL